MSVAQLLNKAVEMGVTLRLAGDIVKVGGPKAAREAIKPELVAHKPEIIRYLRAAAANDSASIPVDCTGALRDLEGGLFLPWAPRLTADDVRLLRGELIAMIENVCSLERWPKECREEVLSRAIRGPLSDLLPNVAYFSERLSEARAEAALDRRAWRFDR